MISYHIYLYPILSLDVLTCPNIPHDILTCTTISRHILFYYITSLTKAAPTRMSYSLVKLDIQVFNPYKYFLISAG